MFTLLPATLPVKAAQGNVMVTGFISFSDFKYLVYFRLINQNVVTLCKAIETTCVSATWT